jgi:SAM-dependent methyltransferase
MMKAESSSAMTARRVSQCLLCGSPRVSEVAEIETERIVRAWRSSFGIDVTDEMGGCAGIVLTSCHDCGLQYFEPQASGSPSLYVELCRNEWYYGAEKWEHDVALEDIGDARRVLEIGCGSGAFIARARDEKGVTVEGLEQNPDALVEATKRGLCVSCGSVERLARTQTELYDVVCSFQVLEHVPSPRAFIDASLALLAPGGRLLLGLPNSESFLRHQFNPLDMPPHHISRWNSEVLRRLPRIFPMRLETVRFEPLARYHVSFYLDAHFSRIRPRRLADVMRRPRLLKSFSDALTATGIRRFLLGQTLYASFVRV